MNLVFRILELVRLLNWALDLIDLYDNRLAAVDGAKAVYTETHIKAKEQARKVLDEYKRMPGYNDTQVEQ
jgi:hypothetical protein